MARTRQHFLIAAAIGTLVAGSGLARRFYPDDPLTREPPPRPVGELRVDTGSASGTFIHDNLHQRGDNKRSPALDVNTVDEVPDNAWYTNRHYIHPLSDAELKLGSGGHQPPSVDQPWTVYGANEGMTPILRIEDSGGRRYALRFDPKQYIELTTGADVVGSKVLHAIGYNVPDNYAVRFDRAQIQTGVNVHFLRDGHRIPLRDSDLDHLLSLTPRYPDGSYRALASRLVDGRLLGPFDYYSTRGDDPNDTVPHERRRVLRGLFVFSAWLDLTDTRSLGTLDTIQLLDGVRAVRHYLTDFGSALGSGDLRPKESWEGHTYAVDLRWGLKEMLTLGVYSPKWERARAAGLPAAGRYESDTFDPAHWKPIYPNPAFDNRTVADCFWAAKQVRSFSDDQIRTIVSTGQYSDPKTVETLAHAMIVRRDKIAAYYLAQTVPLDGFEVREGILRYKDLGGNGKYSIAWSRYDNDTDRKWPIADAKTFGMPRIPGYLAADISDGIHRMAVYLRDGKVVGLDR